MRLKTTLTAVFLFNSVLFIPSTWAASGPCGGTMSELNAPTQALFDLITDQSPDAVMDLGRVKELLAEGADVNALDGAGGNSFLEAAQTYAGVVTGNYSANQTAQASAAAVSVLQYLLEQGADISSCDGRDFTPAGYLMAFGARYGVDVTSVFDMMISAHANFGVQGGLNGQSLIYILASGNPFYQPYLDRVLAQQKILNVDLTVKTARGETVLHQAATRPKAKPDGPLFLEYMYGLLPPSVASSYIDLADISGETPLTFAIRAKNADAVEYLLQKFSVKLDRRTTDHQTPLDIAREVGDQTVIDLLMKHGAPASPSEDSASISCDSPNEQTPSIDLLKKIALEKCKDQVKSVDDLLPLLPSTLRSNYLMVYMSQSLQGASFSHPRIILFARDGKLLLAFNGDPSQARYNDLEMISFNDDHKDFEFHKLSFSNPGKSGGTLSEKNPAECLTCHRSDQRPNWEHWSFWPGVYYGDMETLFPQERQLFQSYIATQNSSEPNRYQSLLPRSLAPVHTIFGDANLGTGFNTRMDEMLESLMAQKAAREMRENSELRPYRYALLGALSCQESVDDFLTPNAKKKLPRAYDDILAEVHSFGVQEANLQYTIQNAAIPGTPVGLYNTAALKNPYAFNCSGNQCDERRVASLRYIVEGLLGPKAMAGWFDHFDEGTDYYATFSVTPLEGVAWKELLHPIKDRDLYPIYQNALPELDAQAGDISSWIYTDNGKAAQQLCPVLKQKSLKALSNID